MDNRSATRDWVVVWIFYVPGNRGPNPFTTSNCCDNDSL